MDISTNVFFKQSVKDIVAMFNDGEGDLSELMVEMIRRDEYWKTQKRNMTYASRALFWYIQNHTDCTELPDQQDMIEQYKAATSKAKPAKKAAEVPDDVIAERLAAIMGTSKPAAKVEAKPEPKAEPTPEPEAKPATNGKAKATNGKAKGKPASPKLDDDVIAALGCIKEHINEPEVFAEVMVMLGERLRGGK